MSRNPGKTALAMAALWCLAGVTDSRPASGPLDSTATDVIHSPGGVMAAAEAEGSVGPAEVVVTGRGRNGLEFEVRRSMPVLGPVDVD